MSIPTEQIVPSEPVQLMTPVGISGALALFETIKSDLYERQKRKLQGIVISDDDSSWTYSDGTPGGDALDLLERFGYLERSEWVREINEILEGCSTEQRESFKPNAQPISDEDDSFPLDVLPSSLRDLCERLGKLNGVPVQFPAALAIATMGAAAGKGVKIKTFRDLSTYPNIYVLAGVLSGVAKSTVGKPIFEPMFLYQAEKRKQHAAELPKLQAQLALVQKEINDLLKRATSEEKDND